MSKKIKTVPVVDKKDNNVICCERRGEKPVKECCSATGCQCGSECSCECGCGCSCNSSSTSGAIPKCLTTLIGAAMISASIFIVGEKVLSPQLPGDKTLDAHISRYVRQNAGVIVQAIEDHQLKIQKEKEIEEKRAQQEAAQKQAEIVGKYTQQIIDDTANYSLGNKDGKFVIIEFFDYNCGWCKKTNTEMWEKISSGKAPNIRWIPLDTPIFGEGSAEISRFVLAAGKQGKYTEMHHAVVEQKGRVTKEVLIEIAKTLGLDTEKLVADASSAEISKKIESNMNLANEIGIQGVPFMIVNGTPNPGALFGEHLEQVIAESNQ